MLLKSLKGLPIYAYPVLLIGLVGSADGLCMEVKPLIRLSVIIEIGMLAFLIEPELLPSRLLYLRGAKSSWTMFVSGIASSLLSVGFVGAASILGGDDGLLSGVGIASLWVAL